MKLNKVVGVIALLITVSLTLFVACAKNSPDTGTKSATVSNTASPDDNDKLSPDSSEDVSVENTSKLMQKIDSRVKTVKDKINNEWYQDHYEGDILMYHHIERGDDKHENYATYFLYYDEQGKLIYAEITHYRDAAYSIYFHNDELLHVEVGPSVKGGLFINGDMANVKAVIKKDPSYSFVQEDNSLCLEYAYK